MKKIKDFLRDYQERGEADAEFHISLWHIIIVAALIGYAIYLFI